MTFEKFDWRNRYCPDDSWSVTINENDNHRHRTILAKHSLYSLVIFFLQ